MGVFDDLGNIIQLVAPVSTVLGCYLLKGLLTTLQCELVGTAFLLRVNPLLRRSDPLMLKVVIFVIPKSGHIE